MPSAWVTLDLKGERFVREIDQRRLLVHLLRDELGCHDIVEAVQHAAKLQATDGATPPPSPGDPAVPATGLGA